MAVNLEVPLGASLVKCPYRAKLKPPVLPADTYFTNRIDSMMKIVLLNVEQICYNKNITV
ncbi:hypothetical protein C2I17_11795 [Niallia circulans]|nr:hypothetical protein C2I17_11795 [Niallia circulans]